MIPYNWTEKEETEVNKILQLIAIADISLYVRPSVPTREEKQTLKSAFTKMVEIMLNRKLKGEVK